MSHTPEEIAAWRASLPAIRARTTRFNASFRALVAGGWVPQDGYCRTWARDVDGVTESISVTHDEDGTLQPERV